MIFIPLVLVGFTFIDARPAVANCRVVASATAEVVQGVYGQTAAVQASVTVRTVCSDPGRPAAAQGGGNGGEASCRTAPLGPLAEVQAVWAAVNAQESVDPQYAGNDSNPGSLDVVQSRWIRIVGAQPQVLYRISCVGQPGVERWITLTPDGGGNLVPQIRAADLVPSVHAEVIRRLPTPVPRIGPADEDPDGFAFVQNATYFWVDQGAGQWQVVSASTGAGGISVTVRAAPERLVVNPGDGGDPVVCVGAPPAITRAVFEPGIDGCSYTYRDSSAMAPNGQTFPVVASIVWHVTWSASTGEGGDLGYVSTTSDVRDLPVAEVQAVIVERGGG